MAGIVAGQSICNVTTPNLLLTSCQIFHSEEIVQDHISLYSYVTSSAM